MSWLSERYGVRNGRPKTALYKMETPRMGSGVPFAIAVGLRVEDQLTCVV